MKGRWAAGITPRNFAWIIKGHLAVSERPGGSAPDHRRVRRQEEIFWLRAQGFTRVVSLLPSTHNLHAYEELGLECAHVPMGMYADIPTVLGELYPKLLGWLHAGDRILVHQDELGDRIAGVFAGFLWWSGMIPEPPLAISAIEHLLRRQLGAAGRTIATLALEIPPPPEEDRRHPAPPPEETVVELRPEDAETPAPAGPVVSGGGEPAAPGGDARETPDDAVAPVADISARRSTLRSRRRKPEATEPQPVSPLKSTRTASHPTGDTASDPPAGATREPSRPPAPRTSRVANRKLPPQTAKPEVPKPAPKAVKAAPRPPVPRVQGTSSGASTRVPKGTSGSRPVPPHRHLGAR
jgi:hypothetical protein